MKPSYLDWYADGQADWGDGVDDKHYWFPIILVALVILYFTLKNL